MINTGDKMNDLQNDDEISVWDVVNFLKDGWCWLVGGLLLGLAYAVGYLVVMPLVYEATAVLQPATVGMPITAATTTVISMKGAEIEPVARTLERLKLPTFYTDELVKTCQASSMQALASSVAANQVKGDALIQVSYRASTVAVAEACVNAVISQLINSQASVAAPLIKALEEQLQGTQRQLNEAVSFQSQLEKRAVAGSDTASLLVLALSKRESVVRLQKLVDEEKVLLSAPVTQPMQLLEPIYVPEKPVLPKKLPVLAAGVLGGLVLGGLAFLVRRSWLARKAA